MSTVVIFPVSQETGVPTWGWQLVYSVLLNNISPNFNPSLKQNQVRMHHALNKNLKLEKGMHGRSLGSGQGRVLRIDTKPGLIKTTRPAANGLSRKKPRQVSLLECQPSHMAVMSSTNMSSFIHSTPECKWLMGHRLSMPGRRKRMQKPPIWQRTKT